MQLRSFLIVSNKDHLVTGAKNKWELGASVCPMVSSSFSNCYIDKCEDSGISSQ